MSDRIEALEAELEMEQAAAEFRAAKEALAEKDTPQRRLNYEQSKEVLHERRRRWREEHRQAPSGEGDAGVAPGTAKGSVT